MGLFVHGLSQLGFRYAISPSCAGATFLAPAVMLGTGVEYKVWNQIWIGADFRYQFAGNGVNTSVTAPNGTVYQQVTSVSGLMTGAYMGAGF